MAKLNYNLFYFYRPHIKSFVEIVTYVVFIVNGVILYFDVPEFSHEIILTNHIGIKNYLDVAGS